MSTTPTATTTECSTLPRSYIGARRNRQYIDNCFATSSVGSLLRSPSSKPDALNTTTTDTLQAQQEEHASSEHLLSSSSLDARQLHRQPQQQQQAEKAKGFSPPSSTPFCLSSSPSPFLLPTTTHDVPLPSHSGHSSPSFFAEQHRQPAHSPCQHRHPSHRYEPHSSRQPLSSENKNNQLLLLEEHQPHKEEQQQQQQQCKQSPANSLSVSNQNVLELSNTPEEHNSFSPPRSSIDATVEHRGNDHQPHRFTPTLADARRTSDCSTANNRNFPSVSTGENKNSSSSPYAPASRVVDHSTSHSRSAAQENPLSNMSTSRYASLPAHPYDQRISDQGNKYVIQLKTDEYQENEFVVTPRAALNQIVIDAKHREEDTYGGYVHRELHKIFNVPKHIDLNRYAFTYNTHSQEVTVEMPYLPVPHSASPTVSSKVRFSDEPLANVAESGHPANNTVSFMSPSSTRANYSTHGFMVNDSGHGSKNTPAGSVAAPSPGKPFDFDLFHRSPFRPQIVRGAADDSSARRLLMSLDLSDYQAEDIKVEVKDRELIVKAERKVESGTRKSRSSFFQATSLPPQTDINHVQTNFADGRLTIEAPYLEHNPADRRAKPASVTSSAYPQGSHWQNVSELKAESTTDNPLQHRTETVQEVVRVRRLRNYN